MTKSISTRQLCFFLAFFLPVNKLVLLPSALSGTAAGDLLFSAFFAFLAQGAAVFCVLWLMNKNTPPVSALIEKKWGNGGKNVYLAVMGAFFVFSAFYPMLEWWSYVFNTMYDTRPSFLVFAPFFLFSAYAGSKSLRAVGRSADVALFFFPLSLVLLLLMSVGSADFTALPPVGGAGISAVAKGAYLTASYCAEGAYLLGFVGEVKTEKKFLLKTMLAYAVGAVTVLAFLTVFYGIFSEVGVRELYAIAKIARYYNALKSIGRVDYFFLYAIAIVQLFALVVPVVLAVRTFSELFKTKKFGSISLAVNAALGIAVFFSADYFLTVNKWLTAYLTPVYIAFAFVLPVCSLFLSQKGGSHV